MFFKAERKSALAVVLALCIMFIAVPVFAQGGNETAAKVDMTKDADGIAWRQFAGTELHLGMNKHAIDSLKVLGKYLLGVHIKDGKYPTNGRELGMEVPIGKGDVDMPRLLEKIRELGYEEPLTIEIELDRREGEESPESAISYAVEYLNSH